LDVEKSFIRPSYYFSNWLGYLETVEQYGILPTFFPEDLKIEMHSPVDLAKFIAKIMTGMSPEKKKIYELTGQQKYSSLDVANTLSKLLNKKVAVQSIPQVRSETIFETATPVATLGNPLSYNMIRRHCDK
jgi:uncharacterized protein YbjT (DUF2867 family)